jgi:hypothetical protein
MIVHAHVMGFFAIEQHPLEPTAAEKLKFCIEGEIDRKAIRSRPRKTSRDDGRCREWKQKLAAGMHRQ